MDTIDPIVSIPEFYANRSIFITGGTGFMGKILIEKLLRSCPDVREIFVLLRPKKHLDVHERLKELLSSPAFDRLRKERPLNLEKVIPVKGDINANNLGLSPVERQMLIERVSIIFHVAANVQFNGSLKSMIITNVRATRDICILAEEMKNLVALTYYGTAYSQTDKAVIDEVVYPLKVDWRQLITTAETLDEDVLNIFSLKYIDNFPNTYVFTKRIAEQILQDYSAILPCVVIRPTIVTASYKEPVPGYIDNFNGPFTMVILIGKGVLRVLYGDKDVAQDYVPVDDCTNIVLTTTWKRGMTKFAADKTLSVYNCANGKTNFVTPEQLNVIGMPKFERKPLEAIIWSLHCTETKSRFMFHILMFLYHLLPAVLIDGILRLLNRKPMMINLQRKIYVNNIALSYYMFNEWIFRRQNLLTLWNNIPFENKDSFSFGMLCNKIDLEEYVMNCIDGFRKYLLHENPDRHEANLRHYKRMYLIRNIARTIFFIVTIWLLYRTDVFCWVFNVFSYIVKNLIFRQVLM